MNRGSLKKLWMNFTIWLKQHVVYQFCDHIFGMMFCNFQPSIFLGSIILNGQIPVWFISSFPKKARFESDFSHTTCHTAASRDITSHLPGPWCPNTNLHELHCYRVGGGLSLPKTTRTKNDLFVDTLNPQIIKLREQVS